MDNKFRKKLRFGEETPSKLATTLKGRVRGLLRNFEEEKQQTGRKSATGRKEAEIRDQKQSQKCFLESGRGIIKEKENPREEDRSIQQHLTFKETEIQTKFTPFTQGWIRDFLWRGPT